jgi:hypothetical protein
MIDQDVNEIYNFEKNISQVNYFLFRKLIKYNFQFHWTLAEQRARQNETVRTTIGQLSQTFNPSVNISFF